MTIQFMDDFTGYGTDAGRVARMLNGAYAETTRSDLVVDPDATAGGGFVANSFPGGLGASTRRVLSSTQTTIGLAARYWLTSLPATITQNPVLAMFTDINNNQHIRVMCNPAGYLEVSRLDSGGVWTLIGTTTVPVMTANSWKHVETKVFLDGTLGTVQIRLEGAVVLNLSALRTTSNVVSVAATCAQVWFGAGADGSGPQMNLKDFIVWDGTGAVNKDFLGTCQVFKIIPDADISLNWTPNTGVVGFSKVNETTPDDDTGYVSAPFPLPAAMQLNLSDLPTNVTIVKGVQTVHRSRKADAGDGNIQAGLISGANTGVGVNRPITTAYTYWVDVFDQDPSGGSWSKTLVNALKLKLDRTV